MAMRKATIQQQVAQSIYQQNPTDRPIVTIMGMSGPNPLMLAMITALWLLFVKAYFITVTEQAVLVQRASKWTARPLEIVHVIPREQAPYLISDVHPSALWSHFRFMLPGNQKPSRINVNRQWKQEMEYMAQFLYASVPQGQQIPPQGYPAQPQGQFPPQQQAPYPPQQAPQAQYPPQQGQYPPQHHPYQ